jgi:hypothetical protein
MQFVKLRLMELTLPNTVFYGLPLPRPKQSTLQWQTSFGSHLLVLTPGELGSEVRRQGVQRRPFAGTARSSPYWLLDPTFLPAVRNPRSLNSCLAGARACQYGKAIRDGDDVREVTQLIDTAGFGKISPEFVEREIREWLGEISDEERDALHEGLAAGGRVRLPNMVLVPL